MANELQIRQPSAAFQDAHIVAEGFWGKVRRTLGKTPFVDDAVAAYYCALDPTTPSKVKAVLLAALAYFVVPTDLVPDFIAGLGYADDLAVLTGALTAVSGSIRDEHRDHASRVLKKAATEKPAS